MTCGPKCPRIFSRFIRVETWEGEEMIRVGCKHCPAEIRFPARAKLAVVENKILESIRAAGRISASDIHERAGCQRGYMVRVLQRFVADGLIRRTSRGVYEWPRRPEGAVA